ncbi:MAG: cytochrome c biogenesis protein ResB [Clostridia bacterium]|nr:cytochrome c biogenesis protein ResB [Clostridia bacterium]MBR3741309.1 cytochrome c biogenesis protein ResB [Clostridia bacterium]MBR4332349.1 cytochrome c biogenesis protein ResB [Clostridia bacterium]
MKKFLRFFRSMKFGMILLVLVMLLSLAGSLIPQQESAMHYVRAYGSQAAQVMIALGVTDIFHTWYFYALEILLCLNLTLCSILRFPKTRKAGKEWLLRAEKAEGEHPLSSEQREKLCAYLSARHYRVHETADRKVYSKNAAGFYGSFLTHLSILLVLLFGSLVLMTPDIQDRTVMPGSDLILEDGTVITCESFHIQDDTGKLDYASVLTMKSADGSQEKRQEIRVNEPMRFGEYKVYQQTYGTAGRVKITNHANGAEEIMFLTDPCFLSIDGRNGVYFQALYPGFIQDEEGNYTLITSTANSYTDPVYSIQSIADGMSTSVLAFPDEELRIGDISFTFLSPAEYPGLRIKHVSSWLFGGLYFSFGLMVVSLYLCFFAVPVYVKVQPDAFTVLSPKNQQGLTIDLDALLNEKEQEE